MKTAEWFRHDVNARNDIKCAKLRKLHGWQAYGIFWAVVEMLAAEGNYRLPMKDIESVALILDFDPALFDVLFELNLLVNDGEYFLSESLCERMQEFDNKRKRQADGGRRSAQVRAEKARHLCADNVADIKATCKQPASSFELASRIRVEKSRVEKSTEGVQGKQTDEHSESTSDDRDVAREDTGDVCDLTKSQSRKPAKVLRRKASTYSQEFESFWLAYPRKVGKGRAWRAWIAQKPPGPDVLLPSIDRATKSEQWARDGGQYIPHPSTWINDRRWEDEATAIPPPEGAWKKIKEL